MKVEIDGIQYIPAPKPAEGKDLDAALDVRFDSDAGSQLTVREYFRELLITLWDETEGFSGKRPFGNSDWWWDLWIPLAKAGFIDLGEYDEENDEFPHYEDSHKKAADAYCRELIRRVFEIR